MYTFLFQLSRAGTPLLHSKRCQTALSEYNDTFVAGMEGYFDGPQHSVAPSWQMGLL
jgi:hypothetical protein